MERKTIEQNGAKSTVLTCRTISVSTSVKRGVFYRCGYLIKVACDGTVSLWNVMGEHYWYSDVPTVEVMHSVL